MQTYTEFKGNKPFDWNAALDAAIANEPNRAQWKELKDRAGDWPTCACGNLCASIPRGRYCGTPTDETLRGLGFAFFDYIEFREWWQAKEILADIEKRSTEILTTLAAAN